MFIKIICDVFLLKYNVLGKTKIQKSPSPSSNS